MRMFKAHSSTLQEPSPSISLACLQVVCKQIEWSKAQTWHLLSKKYQARAGLRDLLNL